EDRAVITQVQTNCSGGSASLPDERQQSRAPRRAKGASAPSRYSASDLVSPEHGVAKVQLTGDLGRAGRSLQRGQLFLNRRDPHAEGRQFCAELVDQPLNGLDIRSGY